MKGRHFSSDAEVIAAAETWLDGQHSELFFEWLAKVSFNLQKFYILPTEYLYVLYLSENKQRLVPLTA